MSPTVLSLPCPAKLNLFLEVRGKRPDGYHELGTLFQALEFGDTLRAEACDRIEVRGGGVPGKPEDNLIYKAATLLQHRFSDRVRAGQGIRFTLEKRIPMGAGLGGGSSDAATALRLANTLWGLNLKTEELRALAPELGSDVAFFLFGNTAFAEGRGEVLSPAPHPFPFHVVVATPPCHVETAWAYKQLETTGERRWKSFQSEYTERSGSDGFYSRLHNDFERAVIPQFPEIRMVLDTLAAFKPEKAMLTGSGASLFALFRGASDAQACLETVAPLCRFSTITHFLGSEGKTARIY